MASDVTILVPVLDRPAALPKLLETALSDPRAQMLIMTSPGFVEEQEAAERVRDGAPGRVRVEVMEWVNGPGDYARKMNHGMRALETEWAFLGADDIVFHPRWFGECLAVFKRTQACVIGTNDLGNFATTRGFHSTHSLVHRDYLECGTIDETGVILHEGYSHNWVDNEFVETAKARGTYAHAHNARVEHMHPFWHKGDDDNTYEIGRRDYIRDHRHFQQRRRRWQ